MAKEKITGAEALMRSLEHQGVTTLFGYPGGAIMPTFDALYDHRDRLNHILVRHEQGAAHAAQGYARVSGKVGVCLVTSGPGATNTITGVADAMIDSTPIVVIAGQDSSCRRCSVGSSSCFLYRKERTSRTGSARLCKERADRSYRF